MKINNMKIGAVALMLLTTSCTGHFAEINSNPYEVTDEQMQTDGYAIGSALAALGGTIIAPDVNTTQFTDCLLGGPMGGYFADSKQAWKTTISNYNATDDWTRVFMSSDHIIPTLYSNLKELDRVTDDPIALAIGQVIKVAAMHRVTDTYGPIPYSQIGVGGELQVPYDSQKDVYYLMFDELDAAINDLTDNRTSSIAATADYVYGGSAEQWCKFANSLKLRLAMRIVYADPDKAQKMAEEAVAHEVGVFTSNSDNAKMTTFGKDGNPIYVSVKYNTPDGCLTGGDTHVAADITSYMNVYEDPRRPKYFIGSEFPEEENKYVGMRRGIVKPSIDTGRKYSGVNVTVSSPVYWMNAAEVAFLKAEAVAVFGFNMGAGTARDFYEEGIRLSFEQWGVGGYDEYIAQNTPKGINYIDPVGTNSYPSTLTSLAVAWNAGASVDEMQERIITQKWIANWQLGNEAWADYRRTGYPKLIPATAEGNMSNGIVDSNKGARRMPYPHIEYTTNGKNVKQAVTMLTGKQDNMASQMWWDCNPKIWN